MATLAPSAYNKNGSPTSLDQLSPWHVNESTGNTTKKATATHSVVTTEL